MKHNLLLLLGLILTSQAIGQTENVISDKQLAIIIDKTKAFPLHTELSIAFIKNGEVSYYGVKRVADSIAFTNNSNKIFEIGSITKVFTSTLLANLVIAQKIDLNSPIQDHFNFPLKEKEITVLQLANHTSGLPKLPSNLNLEKVDQSNPYKTYDEAALKTYLTTEMVLDSAAGTQYEYSNVGAGILGYLMELQTGLSYDALLHEYILSKYEMKNTTTHIEEVGSNLVKGMDGDGAYTANWFLNSLVAAGGILSNVEDLSKFMVAQLNVEDKALELTRKSTFEIPQYQMEVGLAWNILQPDEEHQWYMHNGGTGGYTSILALDLEHKSGIVILSNVSAIHAQARNIDMLCISLMQTMY